MVDIETLSSLRDDLSGSIDFLSIVDESCTLRLMRKVYSYLRIVYETLAIIRCEYMYLMNVRVGLLRVIDGKSMESEVSVSGC